MNNNQRICMQFDETIRSFERAATGYQKAADADLGEPDARELRLEKLAECERSRSNLLSLRRHYE